MDRFDLEGSGRRVALTRGYAITAPGLAGTGALFLPTPGSTPTRAASPPTDELAAAFRATNVQEAATLALQVRSVPPPPDTAALRSPGGDEALELEVPDLGEERGQIVLSIGEDGVMTWHFPVAEDGASTETPAVRGRGGVKRFRIPRTVAPAPGGAAEHRGFIGAAGRRLLKVLVYPVTDPVLGRIGESFARRWEERSRPYRVRRFSPDDYTAAEASPLDAADWAALAAGRTLLFVHGTFSTSHGCFGALPRELVAELDRRYDGRVIAFDTHTLSEDPDENARRFLDTLPPGIALDLDIVCHSRGGLVTRQIGVRGAAGERVRIRRAVFVGVPNAGTALADADHMVHMIDRFTSAFVLLPSGPVAEAMEAIITAVKVIGHGFVGGLPGLAAMRPSGPFLRQLNGAAVQAAEYYAITADYEPAAGTLRSLVRASAADALMDRIFRDAANDLVVPTDGVYDVPGPAGFPIPAERVLRFDAPAGVTHTTYFAAPGTTDALRNWLLA